MYPVGVDSMAEAVNLVAQERAPVIKQSEEGATYDAMLNKAHLTKINFNQPAKKIHDFIRGLDSVPGASGILDGKDTKFFGSKLWHGEIPSGKEVQIEGSSKPSIVHEKGLLIFGRLSLKIEKKKSIFQYFLSNCHKTETSLLYILYKYRPLCNLLNFHELPNCFQKRN